MKKRLNNFRFLIPFFLIFYCTTIFLSGAWRKRNVSDTQKKPAREPQKVQRVPKKYAEIIHPYLFAVFPALSLVSDNIAILSINRVVIALAAAMLSISSSVFFLLRAIIKNQQKAGAIVSHSLLLFSSYGYVFDFLSETFRKIQLSHRHLLTVWGILEILLLKLTIKAQHLGAYTDFLNFMSVSLVTLSFAHIVLNKIPRGKNKRQLKQKNNPQINEKTLQNYPDIYYIIVDGHASTSTLREIYGYHDDGFIERLKKRGFYIAENSQSNYAMTMLSLASSLNGDYLHELSELPETDHEGIHTAKRLIEDNFSMRFLKSQGYKTVFLGSGFGISQSNPHADLNIQCSVIDEALGRFIQSSLIRAYADKTNLIKRDKRERVLGMFLELAKTQNIKGPKYVFAHIASPQWPFLFDANGNPNYQEVEEIAQKKDAYLNQLIYIDKQIEALLDRLMTNSVQAPIIILQSDHGPNFAFDGGYNLQHPPQEILREKMRILNAFYLPGMEEELLYDTITPVNTFRLIFNRYFYANLPFVEDCSYFSTLEKPYIFTNVPSVRTMYSPVVSAIQT